MDLKIEIYKWIKGYCKDNNIEQLVVGVSGGIDSAVVSTLCALTGIPTLCLVMPIRQKQDQTDLGVDHCLWLGEHYMNASFEMIDLTPVFEKFEDLFQFPKNELALANSRARLRMMTLYQKAQTFGGIVVGTGNKVEDFGIGFFTKYGDGGVDISPIADLLKTEVWELGKQLGINQKIIDAKPTDGLWDDGRIDEDQLNGMSYQELEESMQLSIEDLDTLSDQQVLNLKKYMTIRTQNLHKMNPIPVFTKTLGGVK
jgi:NAD+ synthase|tara:strand:- start:320 stop:1087 length:768 start_codon:yes stop_codon:yes gene_type:complete